MSTPTPPEPVTTAAAVADWLGMTGTPDPRLTPIVAAVNDYVRSIQGDGTLSESVTLGAVMLAALIHRRRNSPGGVEQFGSELDSAFVARYDPTISQLLGLGGHRDLVVG